MSPSLRIISTADERPDKEAAMTFIRLMTMMSVLPATTSYATWVLI